MGRQLTIIGISILALLIVYFEKFYIHPTPGLIHYVQQVTITDPWTPSIPRNNSSTLSTQQDGSTAGVVADSKFSTGAGEGDATPATKAPIKDKTPPLRFTAKLHMINPLQAFTDYPISWFLCVKMGFARLWWVSANLISCIHPLFGLAAGILIARSAKIDKPERSGGVHAILSATNLAAKEQGGNQTPSSAMDREMQRVTSSNGVGGMVLTPKYSEGGMSQEESVNMIHSGPGSTLGSPQGQFGEEGSTLVTVAPPSGKMAYMQYPVQVNLWTLRLACCLFSFRNFLDGLDGVVARLQRRYRLEDAAIAAASVAITPPPPGGDAAGVNKPATVAYGFNGHSIDVVTDLVGVILCCIGIFVFMMRCGTVLSRHSQLLANVVARGRLDKNRMAMLAKTAAVCGLLFMAIAGCTWESFMMRYSNLFDLHSATNPAIWALEQSAQVRLNMFLWSITCGDSIFTVLIVCLFFNRIWEAVQVLFFCGYPWFLLLVVHSNYVWHWVIMNDPAAYKIIAQTAQFE